MRIETYGQGEALSPSGKREVWVRVMSDEALDWPSIERKLDAYQATELASLGPRHLERYHPTRHGDHEYLMEDWFVWAATA